jgi:predicted small metal-binding protein
LFRWSLACLLGEKQGELPNFCRTQIEATQRSSAMRYAHKNDPEMIEKAGAHGREQHGITEMTDEIKSKVRSAIRKKKKLPKGLNSFNKSLKRHIVPIRISLLHSR